MKHIKKFNEGFFDKLKSKKHDFNDLVNHSLDYLKLPTMTYDECEKKGYYMQAVPVLSKYRFAFSRDFNVGDEVFYLGHDGVGGWWHGDKTIADKELVDKSKESNLHFYKKVARLK